MVEIYWGRNDGIVMSLWSKCKTPEDKIFINKWNYGIISERFNKRGSVFFSVTKQCFSVRLHFGSMQLNLSSSITVTADFKGMSNVPSYQN